MGLSQSKFYRRLSFTEKGHNPLQASRQFDLRDLLLVAFGTVCGTLALIMLGSMIYTRFWTTTREFVPDLPFNTIKIWNQQDQYVGSKDWMKNWDALLGREFHEIFQICLVLQG